MWSSSTSLSDTTDESSGDESKVIFDYPRQPPSYENLKDNIYLQPVQLSKASKKAKKMVCECVYDPDTDEDGGCGEDCLNRLLMIECNPKCCPCGEFCMNQRFQKGQYPKLEVFDARRKGFGLRVLEDVPMGAFVIEYLGEVCTDKEFRNRTKMYAKARLKHHYFMKLKGNEIIDATKKGNESRFINHSHSCDPSCETQKWTVAGVLRVGFFAIKHMKTGDEVTFDYKFQRYGRHDQKCFCGSANCRGVIGVPPKNSAENQSAKVVEPKTKVIPDKSIGTKLPPKRRKRRKKHIVLVSDSQEETDADAEVEPLSSEQPCEENFEEDLTSFQKDLLELIGTEKNLSKDSSIVDFLRLTFSAETLDERITLLSILQATEEQYCLQQFLKRRGLKLLHDWLSDMTDLPFKFKLEEKYRIPKKMAKPLTPFRRHTVDTTTEESPGESPSPRPSYCSDDEHYSRRNKRSRFHNFESFKNQEDFTSQFYSRNTGQRNKRQSRWSRRFHSQDSDQLQYGQSKNPRREKRRYYDSQDNDSYRKRKYNQQQIQYQSMYESQCEPQFSSSFSGSTSQENVDISLTDLQGETLEDSLQQDLQQQETTSEQQLMLQQPHMEMPQKNFQVLIPQEQLQQQQLIQSQQQMQQHQFMQQQPNVSQPLLPVFQTQPIVAVNQPNNIIAPAQPVQSQLLSGLPQLQTIQSLAEFQSQFMRAKTQRPPLLTQPNAFQVPNVPPPPGPGIGIGTIPSQPGISFVPQVPHRMPLPTASSMGGVRFLPPTISAMNPVLGGFMTNPFSVPPPMPLKSQQSTTIPATISTLPVPVSSASIASVATSKIDNQSESMQLVGSDSDSAGEKSQSPPPPPLPSHWRSASDADGRTYYYHVKNRVSQWEFPTEAPGSTSDAKQKQRDEDNAATGFSTTPVTSHEVTSTSDAQQKAYNITPDANAALETWQMALMEESSLVKKKESSLSEKDATSKAKEAFRNKVSQVVVQCLNQHYRPDCSRGRIETSEDFKHLAKKLTYGIMEKHTRNIKQGFMPEFTSGTKSKIHDYVKTYMKKYGEVYRRN
ncbi:histone-lysine N-methyltransferase SETD2-like isoform X2 [Corticium candelabrum]|uniref:histone-lysine N-methyltransferase SETD2-like isoform X2 n=1 Tax=Corticium candelabrum TaxID=121492 RepID=UPI002E269124|nr:histone-lysine N-methyltransferase SETD2-like isoform X2 [Corticium candelabrum]